MNKTELIEHIAQKADISKASAARALDGLIDVVVATLARGDAVSVAGFGTFESTVRPARTGRNPRTGEQLTIASARIAKFRPGKALKDGLN